MERLSRCIPRASFGLLDPVPESGTVALMINLTQAYLVKISFIFLMTLCCSMAHASNDQLGHGLRKSDLGRTYYGFYIGNQKVGFMYEDIQLKKDEIISEVFSKLNVEQPLGGYLSYEITDKIVFDRIDGVGKLFLTRTNAKSYEDLTSLYLDQPSRVEIEDERAELVGTNAYFYRYQVGDVVQTHLLDLPQLDFKSYFSDRNFVHENPQIGQARTIDVYELDFQQNTHRSMTQRLVDKKISSPDDEKSEVFSIFAEVEDYEMSYSVDSDGRLIDGELMGVVFRREAQDLATNLLEQGSPVELGNVKLVDIGSNLDAVIEKIANASVVKLKLSGDQFIETVVENNRQQVLKETEKDVIISVNGKLVSHSENDTHKIRQSLRSSPRYDLSNEDLRKLNPFDSLEELDDLEKIEHLVEFVFNHIDYEERYSLSLSEIIKQQKGDCTEYAQLFVALARLNGFPSNEVSGYSFNYDINDPKFIRHAWAEVYVNDAWIQVDPGWNDVPADMLHIQLNADSVAVGSEIALISVE